MFRLLHLLLSPAPDVHRLATAQRNRRRVARWLHGAHTAWLAMALCASFGGWGPAQARDLTLSEARELMLAANSDLRLAAQAVEAARADHQTAGERPNATLSLNSSSLSLDHGLGPGGLWDKRADTILRVDQPIERGDKRAHRLAAAQAQLQAAQQDADDARRQTWTAVGSAYYDLKAAQQRLQILQDMAALQQRTWQAAQTRVQAGDLAVVEGQRLRVEAVRATTDVQHAQADVRNARIALASLLGQPDQAEDLVAADAWPGAAVTADTATATGPASSASGLRADIAAATQRVEQARSQLALAQAQRVRDVTVGLQYEHNPPDGRNLLGVGVSVPLFTGSDFGGAIRRAQSDVASAEQTLERTRQKAQAEQAGAAADLQAAQQTLHSYDADIVQAARRAAAGAETAYTHGALALSELLDARRSLRAVELELNQAHADHAKALLRWQSATGVLP